MYGTRFSERRFAPGNGGFLDSAQSSVAQDKSGKHKQVQQTSRLRFSLSRTRRTPQKEEKMAEATGLETAASCVTDWTINCNSLLPVQPRRTYSKWIRVGVALLTTLSAPLLAEWC